MKGTKTKIINKKSVINPNGAINGANNILYTDFDAVECLYNSLAEYFTTGKVSGTSHLGKIIQKDFDIIEAGLKKNGPNLNHITTLMDIASKVQQHIDSKKSMDLDYINYLLRKNLFDWQKQVYDDSGKKLCLVCGRRAGKSYVIVDKMIDHCNVGYDNIEVEGRLVKKHRSAIYIGLTIQKAVNNVWQLLKDEIERCRILVNRIDNSNYRIEFANGATIELAGNNSKAEREKLRGKDNSLVVIDEAQSHQGLGYLINSIIGPILKGRNGTLILSGTGPIVANGYWEQIINDPTWSKYTATMVDNPTISPTALEDVLTENGWDASNIIYRREYLAEIVYDTNRLLIPTRSYYTPSDLKNRTFDAAVIGMDYGFRDFNAFVPMVRDYVSKRWYIVDIVRKNELSSSAIVENFKSLVKNIEVKYKINQKSIYAVADSSHQQITTDIYNAGFNNITNAQKLGETQMIQDLAADMAIGNVMLVEKSDVDLALNTASWKYDDERQAVIYEVDDKFNHDNNISDIVDALKYAHRLSLKV